MGQIVRDVNAVYPARALLPDINSPAILPYPKQHSGVNQQTVVRYLIIGVINTPLAALNQKLSRMG
jgi:hypothetical protein